MRRSGKNPIVKIEDVKPSSDRMVVVGVFNAGATLYKGEIILLLRVAEKPLAENESEVRVTYFDEETGTMQIKVLERSGGKYDFSDSRVISSVGEQKYLTSVSHIRIARSWDGINFEVSDKPLIKPFDKYTTYGIEDPRITKIENKYYINFSAISAYGIVTRLFQTENFEDFTDLGNVFHPDNKDVVLFPNKINGMYYALHRPSAYEYGKPNIWIASSCDLIHWGDHKLLASVREDTWEGARIGAGAPPILTKQGWLVLYHGADEANRYCMGAMILDEKEPWRIIRRYAKPLLEPCETYETNGFFANVVFVCGAVEIEDELFVYYGASDDCVCVVKTSINEILDEIGI